MKDKWIELYNNWLKKSISKDDLYILEKRALDDPFVADALEGIELYESENTANLQEKLENKLLFKKKNKLLTLWPYATAASLLLIASVFFLLQSPDEAERAVILNEEVWSVNSDAVIAYQDAPPESKIEMSNEPETLYKKTKESTLQSQIGLSDMAPDLDKSMIDMSDNSKPDIIRAEKIKSQLSQANTATASDETIAKSTIGLQTHSLSYQPQYRNSNSAEQDSASIPIQSSKKLSTPENSNTITKKQKVSAATTTVASKRSYDNIPVISAKSSDNIPNYHSSEGMINIPNEMKIESNNKLEIVLPPGQLGEPNLNSQISISDDSVAEVSEQQYFYHQAITEPKPQIGWLEFNQIILNNMISREEMFMRGIKTGTPSTFILEVMSDYSIKILDPGLLPIENVERIINSAGTWNNLSHPDTIFFDFVIVPKPN